MAREGRKRGSKKRREWEKELKFEGGGVEEEMDGEWEGEVEVKNNEEGWKRKKRRKVEVDGGGGRRVEE